MKLVEKMTLKKCGLFSCRDVKINYTFTNERSSTTCLLIEKRHYLFFLLSSLDSSSVDWLHQPVCLHICDKPTLSRQVFLFFIFFSLSCAVRGIEPCPFKFTRPGISKVPYSGVSPVDREPLFDHASLLLTPFIFTNQIPVTMASWSDREVMRRRMGNDRFTMSTVEASAGCDPA
ncbi:hypothetical protein F5Y12DRAFT_92986 [Xylaria sp. FL1777]|nr:hypothetical protein F5Y12DRAFT_92986 [Xylaria sp. FL1777]